MGLVGVVLLLFLGCLKCSPITVDKLARHSDGITLIVGIGRHPGKCRVDFLF